MRPSEQRTLEAIAADLELHDPWLARQLSAPPGRAGWGESVELHLRGLILATIWLLGISFGATLLGLGLAHHIELTTVVGAALSAAVTVLGMVVLLRRQISRAPG